MALIQLNYASRALACQTDVTVLLPERDGQFDAAAPRAPYRVLYLLHGLTDDRLGWLRYTEIESLVRGTDLAVVMPSVDHGFYTDMVHGHPYFTFVADELPTYLGSVLPLSTRREDTFACGNSMGGYGAFKLALTYPERFAKAVALSGVLDIQRFVDTFELDGFDPRWTFGEELAVAGTDNDLFHLLDEDVRRGIDLPALYSWCGRDDVLLEESRAFQEHAAELGVDCTYVEGDGEHLWVCWAPQMRAIMDWLLA